MPHPIIGVGHSVGASHLTHLSHLHPRLLHSLVLVDPIIQLDLKVHKTLAKLSTSRRDIWPSREVAAESFRNSKFYKTWDPRVLEKWLQFGLRDLPTEQYPEAPEGSSEDDGPPVTLSTTVAQEVYFYVRASYRDERLLQDDDLLQDIHPEDRDGSQLSRPESQKLFRLLPEVKPSVLYVFGGQSDASPPESRLAKMETTGTGVGGSGGADAGKVQEVVLDCGHLVGMSWGGGRLRSGRAMRRWRGFLVGVSELGLMSVGGSRLVLRGSRTDACEEVSVFRMLYRDRRTYIHPSSKHTSHVYLASGSGSFPNRPSFRSDCYQQPHHHCNAFYPGQCSALRSDRHRHHRNRHHAKRHHQPDIQQTIQQHLRHLLRLNRERRPVTERVSHTVPQSVGRTRDPTLLSPQNNPPPRIHGGRAG
jgi:pimeloyl-ACP methyl ester carboxylesterase